MGKQKYYVPILKWKRGEQKGLENVSLLTRDKLMPLIEIPPIDYDYENDRPKKSIDDHICDVCDSIIASFNNKSFIDLLWVESDTQVASGQHPLEAIINEANTKNLTLVPVIGFNRSQEYIDATQRLLVNNSINEVCIRIESNDFQTVNNQLSSMLNHLILQPGQCHLVIDLKAIEQNNLGLYQTILPLVINNLMFLNDWASITLTGTAFPQNLSSVNANSSSIIARTEYLLWDRLVGNNSISIPLQFGDYCISHPDAFEMDPRFMKMSGNLRYTINNGFLIYKGTNVRASGFAQMRAMCTQLINSAHYSGPTFSWGDDCIEKCANGSATTGNAETWRRVGTNHHLEFLTDQLSNSSYF